MLGDNIGMSSKIHNPVVPVLHGTITIYTSTWWWGWGGGVPRQSEQ